LRTFAALYNIDQLVKSQKAPVMSFPRTRESREISRFWTPAFAGVTALETFYEVINIDELVKS